MNQKPDKVIPALYGGVIMAVISAVPFLNLVNCLCCAGILFGGLMAVYFYKNNFTPDTLPFTSGDCMAVGALAGVFSAIIGTILSAMFLLMFGNVMQQFILETLRNMDIQIPSEAWDAIEQQFEAGMTIGSLMLSLFTSLIVDVLFGLLGGLIGYSIFKPKQQPLVPPPPMPQPPSPTTPPL